MQNEIIFETERTYASRWESANASETFEIYGDELVTRWTYGHPIKDVAEMKEKLGFFVARNKTFREGFGSFPVYLKETEQLIGCALIKPLPDTNGNSTEDIEIGWHLRPSVWGKGLATEFGRKLVEIGFNDFGLDCLHAVVHLENKASCNVALRLGMKELGTTNKYYQGQTIWHFQLGNPNKSVEHGL